jgi:hypothetical protein
MQNNLIVPGAASSLARLTSAATIGLCATLLGCSDDSVNMGEGVPEQVRRSGVPSSSRCAESPILEGVVVVHNQQELDQLEGCEVIEGSLYVEPFKGGQLRALHALTAVGGVLSIGLGLEPNTDPELEIPALWGTLAQEGWLSSLEGLEALEGAENLMLAGLTSEDLRPLRSLRWLSEGNLSIWFAKNLKSFDGLQSLTGLRGLVVNTAPQLESFDGLTLPRSMDLMQLIDVDLRRLKPLDAQYIDSLWIDDTQLQDLTPFANLGAATGIEILVNQKLESLAGLEGLGFLQSLSVRGNPSLLEIPDFELVFGLEELRITHSPQLARLPAFPGLDIDPDSFTETPEGEELIRIRPELIWLEELASITTFSMPAGWSSAGMVQIANNANLRSIEFTGQRYVDYLSIQNNPLLETVSTGVLNKVNELHVVDNPRFSVTAFDAIRHLDRTASGNADGP